MHLPRLGVSTCNVSVVEGLREGGGGCVVERQGRARLNINRQRLQSMTSWYGLKLQGTWLGSTLKGPCRQYTSWVH